MFAKLTALVSSSPAFPYQLGDAYGEAWGTGWTHFKGTKKEDGSQVSIFKLTSEGAHDRRLVAAHNGVKRLRMVSTSANKFSACHLALTYALHS